MNNQSDQPATEPVPATALEEKQQLLAHHVRLVARRLTKGLCVYGSKGGIGKSLCVLETLRGEGIAPVIMNSHVTPLSLYMNLFHNQDAIVFLDDCDAMLRSLPTLGLLRSALWGEPDEPRLVTYNSSQLEIPSSFGFTGAIIFAINALPKKNPAFDAVLSRVDQFELDATNEEVLELMRRLACRGFDGLPPDDCLEVVEFIADFTSTREISLRLLEPSLRKMIYARETGCDWRDLVGSQLNRLGGENVARPLDSRSFLLDCVRQAADQYPGCVADQVEMFRRLTGKSRATFFRLKSRRKGECSG